jgi:anti-sigma factor RsiW
VQCDRQGTLLGPYLDGELGTREQREVEAHLLECPSCKRMAEDLHEIGRTIAASGRAPVPTGLASRIRSKIDSAGEGSARSGLGERIIFHFPRLSLATGTLLRNAAVILLACALSSLVTWVVVSANLQTAQLEQETISAHVRSLLADSTIQVASSDVHTVKPWFTGKVEFSPEVKDLATEGFPLLGGRLDYIGGRRVGVLVYKRQLHTISVFVWAAAKEDPEAAASFARNGYNLLKWQRDGISYAAVSDLNRGELMRLQSLL